ncbi:unnamed protein product, partial [Discosporangium mesarthrocarpum]
LFGGVKASNRGVDGWGEAAGATKWHMWLRHRGDSSYNSQASRMACGHTSARATRSAFCSRRRGEKVRRRGRKVRRRFEQGMGMGRRATGCGVRVGRVGRDGRGRRGVRAGGRVLGGGQKKKF